MGKKEAFIAFFFGWNSRQFPLAINIVRSIFVTLFNVLLILPRFALNILKLGTEFIPHFMHRATAHFMNYLIRSITPLPIPTKIFVGVILVAPISALYAVFKLVQLIGRALTSPHRSLYAAWQAGQELAGKGFLGRITSLFFCTLSLALSTFVYLMLFPIAIKLAYTYLPQNITTVIQAAVNLFEPLSQLGVYLSMITTPIFKVMGAFFGTFFASVGTPVVLGIAVLLGVVPTAAIVLLDGIDAGITRFSTWWKTPPERNAPQQIELQPRKEPAKRQPVQAARPQDPAPVRRAQIQERPNQRQAVIPKKQPQPNRNAAPQPPQPVRKEAEPPPAGKIKQTELIQGEKLGSGGFGDVYKGVYKPGNGSQTFVVAMKQVKDRLSDEAAEEYNREIAIMAKLNSPYIVRFHGICRATFTIVMEFVPKGSLWDLLRSAECPSWKKGLYQIAFDVTYGLAYLHSQRVIHADLKSLNVLITADFRAKISDFGLSKIKAGDTQSAATLVGASCGGTTRWMAPELFEYNKGVNKVKTTKKSDVFSYGVVLWELGAKDLPFKDVPNDHVPSAIMKGERPEISRNTPPTMAALIGQCWAKRPKDRPKMEIAKVTLEQEAKRYGCG